jgi:hypothetical protein
MTEDGKKSFPVIELIRHRSSDICPLPSATLS